MKGIVVLIEVGKIGVKRVVVIGGIFGLVMGSGVVFIF